MLFAFVKILNFDKGIHDLVILTEEKSYSVRKIINLCRASCEDPSFLGMTMIGVTLCKILLLYLNLNFDKKLIRQPCLLLFISRQFSD